MTIKFHILMYLTFPLRSSDDGRGEDLETPEVTIASEQSEDTKTTPCGPAEEELEKCKLYSFSSFLAFKKELKDAGGEDRDPFAFSSSRESKDSEMPPEKQGTEGTGYGSSQAPSEDSDHSENSSELQELAAGRDNRCKVLLPEVPAVKQVPSPQGRRNILSSIVIFILVSVCAV